MREYKIVVVGNGGVGKSALGFFVQNYDATIEDSYRKQADVDGQACRLEILDTAGTEQFSGMRDLYVRNGQGFVLVYAVNESRSLRDLEVLRDLIIRIKATKDVPMIIVGNKCDLAAERTVPPAHGRELAKQFNCNFIEASAKTNYNVNEINRIHAIGTKKKKKASKKCNSEETNNDDKKFRCAIL